MKMATISNAKNHLSALLEQVRHGATILILDRNQPIATIAPVAQPLSGGAQEHELDSLERRGLIRRGRKPLPKDFLVGPPPATLDQSSVVESLLTERREGR